jgi:hypothetical protein
VSTVPPGPQPEALFLDFNDDPTDPNAEAREIDAPRYVRTERAPYASDPEQMRPMWEAARESRDAKEVEIDPGGEVLRIEENDLPTPPKPKALVARLEAAGWQTAARAGRVTVGARRYMGRSETHEPGDVRTPEHHVHWWAIRAVLFTKGERIAWLWATWERNDSLSKPANKFESALVWDLVNGRGYEPTATGFEEWVSIFAPKA